MLHRLALLSIFLSSVAEAQPITTSAELVSAVASAKPGSVLELGAGTMELSEPLVLPSGITLKGAGMDKTTLTAAATWIARTDTLPDPEMDRSKFDRTGYLIHLSEKAKEIVIADLTLTAPKLHGAIFGFVNERLEFHHLKIAHFMYSGIRTYAMKQARIHDCVFLNCGIRWSKGEPGIKGGIVGGGIFGIWTADSEIAHNRFLNTGTEPHEHYYGIKGRQGKRLRIHHNTIETNFSIEFPFENDEDVEIDHNVCHGTISIPKHAGGPVPASGRTFHIHHNVFKDTYSIEFVRNGVEIDHNLFDFPVEHDHGNLISGFGQAPTPGPASFHHNLVSNPGRGVVWVNEPINDLAIHHNHIITRTTKTPRQDGLFGFNEKSDFATLRITDNIIECQGTPRPLVRNDASAKAIIENNTLTTITDTTRYANPMKHGERGPGPLQFACGVHDEVSVQDWSAK